MVFGLGTIETVIIVLAFAGLFGKSFIIKSVRDLFAVKREITEEFEKDSDMKKKMKILDKKMNKFKILFSFLLLFFNFFLSYKLLPILIKYSNLKIYSPGGSDSLSVIFSFGLYLFLIQFIPLIVLYIYQNNKDALYSNERKFIRRLFILILFCSLFSTLGGIEEIISLSSFFTMIIKNMFLFFCLPLIPITFFYLINFGVIEREKLTNKRKYIHFSIILFSAIMTPQDPFSLLLIAGPLIFTIEFVFLITLKKFK
jgi:Sec-independent protein secretion pathway component TatC